MHTATCGIAPGIQASPPGASRRRRGCPEAPNPDQLDADGSGGGDACDEDDDGGAVPGGEDECPLNLNPRQLDRNGNAVGDIRDLDANGDPVLDGFDRSLEATVSKVKDTVGRSISGHRPCESGWTNYKGYVACVAHAWEGLVSAEPVTGGKEAPSGRRLRSPPALVPLPPRSRNLTYSYARELATLGSHGWRNPLAEGNPGDIELDVASQKPGRGD